ncbi:MAG: DUF1805 domain-containing protein [Candidatus Bathyarchaeia archaeon]
MITIAQVKVDGKTCLGVRVELPESPPLVLVVAEKGFVMCGFLNVTVAERLGVAAAMISGVKTFEDILDAEVKAATPKAESLGVKTGMRGLEALRLML